MIQRNDYVYPWWESAWFFSKPPLTMWMDALGMQIVGTNRTPGALALYTEWGMRLPFAISALAATALMTVALARTLNRRIAFASMFVRYTMPLYLLLTRQAVTDTPFVACLVSALAFEMRFLTGLLAAILIFGPWLLALSLFEGVDDESKTFFYRFFIHDNLNRLFAGVHTTTPGGTFTYFIEQGGYAIFPWVAALPGALMVAARIKLR